MRLWKKITSWLHWFFITDEGYEEGFIDPPLPMNFPASAGDDTLTKPVRPTFVLTAPAQPVTYTVPDAVMYTILENPYQTAPAVWATPGPGDAAVQIIGQDLSTGLADAGQLAQDVFAAVSTDIGNVAQDVSSIF